MSRTVYYCAASLDGYIAESDDTIDWLTGYQGSFEGEGLEPGPMRPGGSYERFYQNVGRSSAARRRTNSSLITFPQVARGPIPASRTGC